MKNGDTDNHEEILRIKYQDNLWSPIGIPQVSESHEKDFLKIHSQIQKERVQIISTVINKLLASQDNRKGKKSVDSTDLTDSNIRRLEGKKYTLIEDKIQNIISLLAKDGRGKILQISGDSGVACNLNLKAEDVHFFELIPERFAQERQVKQRKNIQNNLVHDFE